MCLTFRSIIYPFCTLCWKLFSTDRKKNLHQLGRWRKQTRWVSLSLSLLLCLALCKVSFYMGPDHIIMQLRNHLNRHHTNFTKLKWNTLRTRLHTRLVVVVVGLPLTWLWSSLRLHKWLSQRQTAEGFLVAAFVVATQHLNCGTFQSE